MRAKCSIEGLRRVAVLGALGLVMVLASASCGTRVDSGASPASSPVSATDPSTAALATVEDAAGIAPTITEGESGGLRGAAPAVNPTGGSGTPRPGAQGTAGPAGSATPGGGPEKATARQPGTPVAGSPTPKPASGEVVPAGVIRLSPVVLASVGTWSGPVGQVLKPMLQGAQVWVKYINQRGGLKGHQVSLITYDDGGDPARHRAQVQQAIEQDGVIAFLMTGEPTTGEPSVEYITTKRVPVVGMTGGEEWAYSSPMYFPQASAGNAYAHTFPPAVAQQVIPRGKTKLGTMTCVEGRICEQLDRIMAERAQGVGLKSVYRARASVAQPDFTAECLAARNAGTEVFFVAMDQNSAGRLATACARQGYRPIFALPGQAISDEMKDDPNLAGVVASTTVFPSFQSGTPATDEYQQAMRTFAPKVPSGAATSLPFGWAAGKIMERAATNLSEPPTSEAILAGLWTIKDETFGGLTQPLTFIKDKPPTAKSCWFGLTVQNRTWLNPDGFKLHCI